MSPAELRDAIKRAMWRGAGHSHWDSTMRHGAGCETCAEQREGRKEAEALLDTPYEQLEAAETTLAHALDFIEHQDMNYRWAEWCEGRNPSTPAKECRDDP